MPVRPSRKQPFKDLIDEDWKIETNTLARLRVLYDEIGERGPMMTDRQLAELGAIRTAWEVVQ
jgi:hypothetical protein